MSPGVLSLYIARRFSAALLFIMLAVAGIIFLAEYLEALRGFGDEEAFTPALGVQFAAMRIPLLLESVLPFAFLFAALLSLINLSAKLELVVARASGVSVWGFLKPTFVVAVLFGALTTLVLNPLAVRSSDASRNMEAAISGASTGREGTLWFRQESSEGASIVSASSAAEDGRVLLGVRAIVFDAEGRFREKVEAARAEFSGGRWLFHDAELVAASSAPRQVARYELPTHLTTAELKRSVAQPAAVSIWSLPGFIESAERTGINADRFRLAFHRLVNRPLFLVAMVMIAATVSLRMTRYGGTWQLVLTGIMCGFLLYVLTEVVNDFGEHGVIDPVLAAWLPPIAALTFGVTALLYLEDG